MLLILLLNYISKQSIKGVNIMTEAEKFNCRLKFRQGIESKVMWLIKSKNLPIKADSKYDLDISCPTKSDGTVSMTFAVKKEDLEFNVISFVYSIDTLFDPACYNLIDRSAGILGKAEGMDSLTLATIRFLKIIFDIAAMAMKVEY